MLTLSEAAIARGVESVEIFQTIHRACKKCGSPTTPNVSGEDGKVYGFYDAHRILRCTKCGTAAVEENLGLIASYYRPPDLEPAPAWLLRVWRVQSALTGFRRRLCAGARKLAGR